MKKLFLWSEVLLIGGILAILLGGSQRAFAQVPGVGSPSGIGVSAFFPAGGVAENKGGSIQAAAELRYGLPGIPLTPTRTVLSVGAEWGSTNGNHSLIVPLTVAEYIGASGKSPSAAGNTYFGIGIGYYLMQQSSYASRGQVGGFGSVGYNFIGGIFIEGKYQVVTRGNGAMVSVGLRF